MSFARDADLSEKRFGVDGVGLDPDYINGVGPQSQGDQLLDVKMDHFVVGLDGLIQQGLVPIELDVAVGAHVQEDIDGVVVKFAQLRVRDGQRDFLVREPLAETL